MASANHNRRQNLIKRLIQTVLIAQVETKYTLLCQRKICMRINDLARVSDPTDGSNLILRRENMKWYLSDR